MFLNVKEVEVVCVYEFCGFKVFCRVVGVVGVNVWLDDKIVCFDVENWVIWFFNFDLVLNCVG